MSNQLPPQLRPLPTDVTFTKYREPGDSGCLCSRCLLPIGKKAHPIVFIASSGQFVLRYHPVCLGFMPCDDDDWEEDYQDLPY
ncbi:hypothetical protein [Nostoc sp. FACHB-110]|uniref:hypothetical protein n=1 Tax=Nostoc sp. FACHB-110 TaxID=2692834 RepID=UPI001682E5A9|nr:hypothetical protein [Nostoc sp. FACHB-110]MBD2438277.1 hypothetical protein [Nostoc sp. FACHB-110]